MNNLKILFLTRYGPLGASSRLRCYQYLPFLVEDGLECTISPFFDDQALSLFYETGHYGFLTLLRSYLRRLIVLFMCQSFDLIWIEKEALPWFPFLVEKLFLQQGSYVLDYDDAVFHAYDQHRFSFIRCLYGKKLDKLMHRSAYTFVGNQYLADRAHLASSPKIAIVPTVVSLSRYCRHSPAIAPKSDSVPIIVWIGSPSTVSYLSSLRNSFQDLAKKVRFKLFVVGGHISIPGIDIECFQWSIDTEVDLIAQSDIGIMPLIDSPWARGKCGYKLIQYMACCLPVVASPVGVNIDLVSHGVNGLLADTSVDWINCLTMLLEQPNLRFRMGVNGRQLIENRYCIEITGPILTSMLHHTAQYI